MPAPNQTTQRRTPGRHWRPKWPGHLKPLRRSSNAQPPDYRPPYPLGAQYPPDHQSHADGGGEQIAARAGSSARPAGLYGGGARAAGEFEWPAGGEAASVASSAEGAAG